MKNPSWIRETNNIFLIHRDCLYPTKIWKKIPLRRKCWMSHRPVRCWHRWASSRPAECRAPGSTAPSRRYPSEASLIVPDVTNSLYGSSCNLLFLVSLFPLFMPYLYFDIPSDQAGFRSRSRGIWLEPEPDSAAGAVTLARLRLHLKYLLNNLCKIYGT